MKKIILILIIVLAVCVTLGGVTYLKMSESERYAYVLNFLDENGLRKEIKNSAYYELNHEECVLNSNQGFESMDKCQQAVNCYVGETANAIPKADLKELAKLMDQGRKAESALADYFSAHKDVLDRLEPLLVKCLEDAGLAR